jgi:hypothetical protein
MGEDLSGDFNAFRHLSQVKARAIEKEVWGDEEPVWALTTNM